MISTPFRSRRSQLRLADAAEFYKEGGRGVAAGILPAQATADHFTDRTGVGRRGGFRRTRISRLASSPAEMLS
jgi:hypothetical protein